MIKHWLLDQVTLVMILILVSLKYIMRKDKTWGCMFYTSIKLVTRSSKFCDDIVINKYKMK